MDALVDEYLGVRMGVDLSKVSCDETTIVESGRRLSPETSYGYVHALWWLCFYDGRSVIAVPPGARSSIQAFIGNGGRPPLPSRAVGARLAAYMDPVIEASGLVRDDRIQTGHLFACDERGLCRHSMAACAKLADAEVCLAEGIYVPRRCIQDGVAFGVLAEHAVVSVAYAHRSGALQERVADVGVETTAEYRRRGMASASVSALVADYCSRGGQAIYGCSRDNVPSITTAKSVGFQPYAQSLVLSAHRGDAGR